VAPEGFEPEEVDRLRVAAMRLARSLRTASADEGLTPAQSGVLATLVREGPTRLGDLAAAEGLNPTMLSRVLGHLEEAGLARRRADDEDRRVSWAAATPAGRRLMTRLRRRRNALLLAHLDRLSEPDAGTLLAALPALERLADLAGEPAGAPAAREEPA
jgi:DNA-binding MarR family transcriptional regulator